MTHKHAPGPIGTSCLTCKRRRKKCDRSQPTCERCTKGGFDCLGYNRNDRVASHFILVDNLKEPGQQEDATSGSHAQPYQPRPLHAHPATENSWMMFPFVTLSSLEEQPVIYDTHASSILNAPLAPHLDGHLLHVLNVDKDDLTEYDAPFLVDSQQLLPAWQTPSPSQTYSAEHPFASTPGRSSLYSKNSPQGAPLSLYPSTSPQSRGQHAISIPRSVTLEPTDIANIVNYVLTQCERLATLSHFKPLPHQLVKFRKLVSGRLQSPGVARWVMYLGAQISESLFDGVLPEKAAVYERWIQKLEQELHMTPSRDITNDEVQNRLSCELEVGFLRLRLKYNFHILKLLRKCAPIFLQIVFSDPTLWLHGHNPAAVSVSHALSSARYELGHFIFLDTFCAMVYALPSTLEYDTSCPPFEMKIHPLEWVHGCPTELHLALIDINARRALGYVAPDWQDIERRILSWQSRPDNTAEEARQQIARIAVQEIWRQTLLAYLYMAVCGVASDDPRVQSAVQQIFQLLSTIRRQDPPLGNTQLLVQHLIAGACTPSEKRRALVRAQLLNSHGNGLRLLSGGDFVPLLDHLWHGAAADGRPIRWSDYIASRQATLQVWL